jgi:hypothetical protein
MATAMRLLLLSMAMAMTAPTTTVLVGAMATMTRVVACRTLQHRTWRTNSSASQVCSELWAAA